MKAGPTETGAVQTVVGSLCPRRADGLKYKRTGKAQKLGKKKKCSGKENIMVLYLLWSLKILARNKSRIKKEKSKQSTE